MSAMCFWDSIPIRITVPNMLRQAAFVPLFVVGLGTAVLGCGSGHKAQVIAPLGTPAWLRAEAVRAAADLGDKHPTLIHFFVSRRQDKVVMHGHFSCASCSRPSNSTAIQTGTVVVVSYDARTRRETDFGIGDFTGPDRTIT